MATVRSELVRIAKASIEEFLSTSDGFKEYSSTSQNIAPSDGVASYAAIVGYTGELIKGSLVLLCDKRLLEVSHPNLAMGMPVEDQDLNDWIGEVANQLLGRMKNKFSASGLKCTMGTPTILVAQALNVADPKEGFRECLNYVGPHQNVSVYFIAIVDPTVTVESLSPKAESASAVEGDSFLF
ncbi:MAG: chemotaxis protein CheX [Bdellovibrionota bacterium]|nr:MAG: chemotaxis protein CheX [Pseudomonadota bacterium]